MIDQVQMTRAQVRALMLRAGRRYRGEPPQFRFGAISILHDIAEHDGDENKCDCFPDMASLRAFFKLIGDDWKEVWES
jgi:hypothetical protein